MEKIYLTIQDVCDYLGVSKSYVYKLSFNNLIPKYCPGGKLIYFKKCDIDDWVGKCRIASVEELNAEAELATYKNRGAAK
jgi:excisionase family DNA binding protein